MATSTTVKIALANLTFSLATGTHSTKGHAIYVAVPSGRVTKEDFKTVASLSHTHKGSYAQNAHFTNNATPDGYTFKTVEDRTAFLAAFAALDKGTAAPKAKKPATSVAQVSAGPVAADAASKLYVVDATLGIRPATPGEVMAAFRALIAR